MLYVVIRPPGRAPYRISLERLTQAVTMGRLSRAIGQALDAKAGLETAVENDVATYVGRVQQAHKRREQVFQKQHEALDVDISDLAELERDLEEFGKNDRSTVGGSAYNGTAPLKP